MRNQERKTRTNEERGRRKIKEDDEEEGEEGTNIWMNGEGGKRSEGTT